MGLERHGITENMAVGGYVRFVLPNGTEGTACSSPWMGVNIQTNNGG